MVSRGLPIGDGFEGLYAPASISLNGKKASEDDLPAYTVDDVKYIHWIRRGGLVEIILKEETIGNGPRIDTHYAIGYAESVEFYSPIYDTPEKIADEKPDIRTTLYWNPYLQIGPDGTAQIEFYSNDHKNQQYDIAIEGITPDGKTCRYRKDISAR